MSAWSCAEPASAIRSPVTLRIGVASPEPTAPERFASAFLLSEGVIGIGWDGRPVPKVVSAWEWLSERRGVRLTLQSGLTFHDGLTVDAELARTILTQTFRDPRNSSFALSFASVKSVDVADDSTLEVRLSRPEALLLADLANSSFNHPTDQKVGLGPYRVVQRENGLGLAAFDKYYRGRPAVDFITVHRYQEQRSAWAALMRGDITAVHEISPGAADFVEAQKTVRTFPFIRPYYISLIFNVRRPVLRQRAVRQALSYAVDRQQIIDVGLHGRGMPAQGPIWPYHWAYSTTQRSYEFNREAATLRMDAAGLKVRSTSTSEMPSRLRFTCLTVNEERYERLALILQKQLYDIGVDMQIESVAVTELGRRVVAGNFDALLLEWASGRSLAWTYMSFHSGFAPKLGINHGYQAADGLLEALRGSRSDEETRQLVGDLQRLFFEDPPAIYLAWPKVSRAVSTSFAVPDEPGRDVMGSLWQWRPAGTAP